MPAPRRPWPPSRPSRPPSLHESACERASRQRPPSPSSSRGPSCSDNLSSTWRAVNGCGCGVNGVDAWRRGDCGCGVDAWRRGCTAALGDGGTCGRRRGEVQVAAAATRAGGAEWLRGRRGERARTAHGGGSAGARRRCGGTAAARREGGGGSRWMRVKQRGKRGGGSSTTHI